MNVALASTGRWQLLTMALALAAGNSAHAADAAPAAPWWSSSQGMLDALGIESWADAPRAGRWSGSLGGSYDSQRQTLRVPAGSDQRFSSRLTSATASIRNEGFALVDPGLLTGNVGLRFSRQQSRQDANDTRVAQSGLLTDYSFDAVVLGEKPYSADVVANRSQGQNTQPSGGITRSASENRSVTLRLREDSVLRDKGILPWFSASVRFAEEHYKEHTQVADQSFVRDDARKLFAADAHNGFETADLDFHYERSDLSNKIYLPGNYRSQTARLNYSLDFGPARNWRWDSRVNYAMRGGSSPRSDFTVDESLAVEHYDNLSSAYSYQFMRQKTPDGTVTSQSGTANLQHRLYANLTTNAGLNTTHQVFPGGVRESTGAQLSSNYAHGLPWGGQVSVSLGGSHSVNNNQLQAGYQQVFDSPYKAPTQLGAGAGFLLADPFVVAESVVVVDVKGAVRIPTVAGVDYVLVAEGSRTRIEPLAGSAIIQGSDLLEVSYTFRLDPSVKYQASSDSASMSVNWNWIGLALDHDATHQKPLAGGDSSYLVDTRRDKVRVNVQGDWGAIRARADATLTRYIDHIDDYRERHVAGSVAYQPTLNWTFNANADQGRTSYVSPQRQSDVRSFSLATDWLAPGGWTVTGNLSRRQMKDTLLLPETISDASLQVHRRWLKLDLVGRFGVVERVRGGVRSSSAMIHAGAVRQF